jgi:hypothetical protein
MSIATLKRKSGAMNARMASNSPLGFSLNNTQRTIGYIGQTSLSKHYNGNHMKGSIVKAHGGCCGTYRTTNTPNPFIQTLTEPPSIRNIRVSTKNNTGLLMTKYRWVRRPQPFSATKTHVDTTITQDMLTKYLKQKAINQANICNKNAVVENRVDFNGCPIKCYYKEEKYNPVMSSSEYILKKLIYKCQELDTMQFPRSLNGAPFGCPQVRSTSDSNRIS